jgi:hypothetical protein
MFPRIHESIIFVFPFAEIVPRELTVLSAFLRMLQLLISYSAPDVQNIMHEYRVAMLSAIEQYENEQVIVFE